MPHDLSALPVRFLEETLRLFVEISPYLMLGFLFAGLLHTLLGESYIRRHFSKSGWGSTIKAAVFGIPLPVCSCAVIPLAESMRKDGASKSATMAFMVSTPSSGVDSIMATYALMGPVYAVFRPIASFLSGVFVGIVTHFKGDDNGKDNGKDNGEEKSGKEKNQSPGQAAIDTSTPNAPPRKPKKSVKEAMTYGFKIIPGEIAKWLIVGVIVGGAISALVPEDFGTRYLGSPILNYLAVLAVSIPLYVCATGSIPIAASLIAKGVLPGAALAFLIAGPATNSVTISFVYKRMGKKITFFYVLSIAIVSIVTGIVFDTLVTGIGPGTSFVAAGGEHIPHFIQYSCAGAMILIFLNSRFDLLARAAKRLKRRDQMTGNNDNGNAPNTHTVTVPDMTCQHCKMKITNALERVPGIQSVSIDLPQHEVTVETEIERQKIIDILKQEGYQPQ